MADALHAGPMPLLLQQRQMATAFNADRYPSLAVRRDRLRRAMHQLLQNESRIVEALDSDFGGRHEAMTLLGDVVTPIRMLRYCHDKLATWMRPEKRAAEFPLNLLGAKTYVFYQPLGVVGIMSPWNAPVALSFNPLAAVLAAGNRAMIKPSEFTPATSRLIAEMVAAAFNPDEVTVIEGGAEVAASFSELPFDHLIYTGGAGVARKVMAAAAKNLVPLTLELGGKSPAIVAPGADIEYACNKIAFGKLVNAGQICMAPDFALVPRKDVPAFSDAMVAAMGRYFPDPANNPQFTRVHLPQQRQRLLGLLSQARSAGAELKVVGDYPLDALESLDKLPPVVVINPPANSELMREEIFGPVLPIVPYDDFQALPEVLTSLARPLGMYLLGADAKQQRFMLENCHAGGVSVNDVMLHPFMQNLPFGGVGSSGMGRYHGIEGFRNFSNAKAVAQRPWLDITRVMAPPFKDSTATHLKRAAKFLAVKK